MLRIINEKMSDSEKTIYFENVQLTIEIESLSTLYEKLWLNIL